MLFFSFDFFFGETAMQQKKCIFSTSSFSKKKKYPVDFDNELKIGYTSDMI